MNFRKVVFALATAGLGLTGIASAQIQCTGGLGASVPTIRAEGTTEVVSTMTISGCSGTANTTQVSVSVTTSAGIANVATSSSSTATDATATLEGSAPVNGVVQGNALVFTFNTSSIPGTPGTTIVISGVRVNASGQAVGTNITASVTASAGLNFGGTGVYSNVAVANPSHAVGAPVVGGFTNVPICNASSAPIPVLEAQIPNAFFGAFTPSAGGNVFIQVTFGNLVPGVNYYVPIHEAGATGGLTLTLVSSTAVPIVPAPDISIGSTTGGVHVDHVGALTASGGSATATYAVTGATALANQSFIVPLYAVVPSGTTAGINGPATVMAQLAGPSSGATYDGFAAPNPAPTAVAAKAGTGLADVTALTGTGAVAPGTPNSTGELTSCATTLLFPYVLNAGGYDTGVALTNSTASIGKSQDGTCSVQFFGTGAPATNPYVTDTIKAGTVGAFTVSSVASGFVGYAIASCNFGDAHGFAFITDGFGAPGRGLSQGYLAIVTARGGAAITTNPF